MVEFSLHLTCYQGSIHTALNSIYYTELKRVSTSVLGNMHTFTVPFSLFYTRCSIYIVHCSHRTVYMMFYTVIPFQSISTTHINTTQYIQRAQQIIKREVERERESERDRLSDDHMDDNKNGFVCMFHILSTDTVLMRTFLLISCFVRLNDRTASYTVPISIRFASSFCLRSFSQSIFIGFLSFHSI